MRKAKDLFLNTITYISSGFGCLILIILLLFIFKNGIRLLDWSLITSDYHQETYQVNITNTKNYHLGDYRNPQMEGVIYSNVWGIGLQDDVDQNNEKIVTIKYLAPLSPFATIAKLEVGYQISKMTMTNETGDYLLALAKSGAEPMIAMLAEATMITDMIATSGGGGIRGSLLTTLYLIVLTLAIALPLGISAAIYLHEFAKQNQFTRIIRTMIDITTGIPSIIFGLVGAIVFIPMMNQTIQSNGGSIASGALTLTIVLLPIIIKTTEESLKVIPDSYRMASLALGASRSQTTFQVILPNAVRGILTATLLSIGRIIGESAALIYAVGTAIKDSVAMNEKSTSLAVHIWSLMSGENPNYELSCAISIIILLIVGIISLGVKVISRNINKMEVK
ncbi:MAG: phosphate ABC transporter permease PstA [Bacilli bacterium]|jgi:phosphate transport system permease protein|nr:phosphate ABC transporter permease PstA [Bacilli bacterium]